MELRHAKRKQAKIKMGLQAPSLGSILVVDQHVKVKRLHCPFRVKATVSIFPDIIEEKYYMVDFVKMTLELKEVFIIRGKE